MFLLAVRSESVQAVQLPAGPSHLCEIPEELLHCINRHLTPRDQQSVFLTCQQLYSEAAAARE